MAELRNDPISVVAVLGSREGCAAASSLDDARSYPVAPDEVVVLDAVAVEPITDAVHAVDPDAVVEDVSDGWERLVLKGDGAREAFARVSELVLPDHGYVQGEVARVAVRVVVTPDRLELLVPAMWADHLEQRLRTDAVELLT